jgi:hypothetical protein
MVRGPSQVSVSLLAIAAVYGALFACTGDDPLLSSGGGGGGGVDAGTGEASVESDAEVVADGAVDSGVDGAPVCSTALPFRDDFELRNDLRGCWDGLTKSGVLASTSSGELGLAALNHGFRVTLEPPDSGLAAGGAVYLAKKVAPAPAPVRLAFQWTPEMYPPGGNGENGLYAVELFYQYKDPNLNVKPGSISVAFGVNGKFINPYLKGEPFSPLAALEGGPFVTTLMLSSLGALTLSTTPAGVDRVVSLPTGTEYAVTEIRIGVTDVGSITEPWSLFFDDVILERK